MAVPAQSSFDLMLIAGAVEPITGGVFSSATLNATVFGGEAYPALYNNQTVQVAEIRIYGNTSDDVPFFIQEAGVGAPTAQFTRIVSRRHMW